MENSEIFEQQDAVPGKKKENVFLSNLHDVVFLVAGVLLVFSILFRVVIVSGPSMKNTLIDGDWLLLMGNVLYHNPKQGDVIVACKEAYENGTPIVKRVIATEGQVVDIDFATGTVKVDDVVLNEPYILTPTDRDEGVQFPLTVPEGCLFVLGDNRGESKDSRSPEIGLIDEREVLGKAIFIIFPGNDKGSIERDIGRIGVIS